MTNQLVHVGSTIYSGSKHQRQQIKLCLKKVHFVSQLYWCCLLVELIVVHNIPCIHMPDLHICVSGELNSEANEECTYYARATCLQFFPTNIYGPFRRKSRSHWNEQGHVCLIRCDFFPTYLCREWTTCPHKIVMSCVNSPLHTICKQPRKTNESKELLQNVNSV